MGRSWRVKKKLKEGNEVHGKDQGGHGGLDTNYWKCNGTMAKQGRQDHIMGNETHDRGKECISSFLETSNMTHL